MSNLNEFALNRSASMQRNILRNVYVWMTLAIAITATVAYVVSQNEGLVEYLFLSNLIWPIIIVEVIMVFALSGFVMKMSPLVAIVVFAAYSILNGLSLSFIFLIYDASAILRALVISSGLFAAMSIYAVTTKRDLSGWGHYLIMGVIGLLIAGVVNIFVASSAFDFLISIAGVVIFTLLTAYDTQKIKRLSDQLGSDIVEADYIRLSIVGALSLYLDFINIFIFLLRFFGGSRN